MKKFTLSLALLTALALSTPLTGFGADAKKKEKPTASNQPTEKAGGDQTVGKTDAKPAGEKPTGFGGKVSAVDASAKTFTVKNKTSERVFHVTESTKIKKDGAAADMSAIAVGDAVTGSHMKKGDTMDAVTVNLGERKAAAKGEKKTEEKAPEKKADKK